MKTEIHPQYFQDAVTVCANCKKEFTFGNTKETVQVEICSNCHPFYTGKKMLIDTEGRVDKFQQKRAAAKPVAKKDRKKKTLEERVNEELSAQLAKEKAKLAKKED
ncbi:50S ribosomal protein L31 [Candidatus Peregrinibacteria bacterium]|nr:MAG: 50S ribosomal protein L31 [Candidatus Peregrinibacteria bacterium]